MEFAGLASGRGRTLLRLAETRPGDTEVAVVIADDPDAPVRDGAEARGIPTDVVDGGDPDAIAHALADHDVDLAVADGFGPDLGDAVDALPTTITMHRSLLPAFPGNDPVAAALDAGVRTTGATAYVVTGDGPGEAPIVTQEPVPTYENDDADALGDRIDTEGAVRAATRAVRWFAEGRVTVDREAATVAVEADDGGEFPDRRLGSDDRRDVLRYGENPHQEAAVYVDPTSTEPSVAAAEQVGGDKGMSYVNYRDAEGGLDLVKEFEAPAATVVKHANPAGCATADTLVGAYDRALSTDPMSAFGGVVALNRPCDVPTAERVVDSVKHVVVAPGYEDGALDVLGERETMRALDVTGPEGPTAVGPDDRSETLVDQPITGGRLLQERDRQRLAGEDLEVVTEREPADEQVETMLFAWQVCKHVTSNAIVFADGTETVGLGVGQVSRVDAVELAGKKATEHAEGKSPQGAVMASDAFFPFPDGVEKAAEAGVEAIVQPGGSIRDEGVVEAADDLGLAMAFTGNRAFRHD
jgi:phosphoribosylaminoimidazolecarboxamide formyltransferase/IMP cyclohydrolase